MHGSANSTPSLALTPMDIITKRSRERQSNAGSEQLPQLLDSPLPTPRRSCASTDAPSLRCRRDASPLRTQVPFSWESSPGVPKSRVVHNKAQEMPLPKPPPGRLPPCPSRNWCYGNASEASSDDYDTSSFSDALDRISSPERIGSFDRVTSKRFEDIFVGRATSFVKDRSSHAHAAADGAAIAASSSGRHSKHWRRRGARRDDDGERPKTRQSNDPVEVKVLPRINIGPRVEQMSPRACGLMVFFPWSPNPAVCGFRSPSQSQYGTPRSGAGHPSPSHSRRSTILRDALQEENKTDSGQDSPRQPRGEKRSREEWQGRGWGVSSLLGTSKKYCTDARKALSKLSI